MRIPCVILCSAAIAACTDATAPAVNPRLLPLDEGAITNSGYRRSVSYAFTTTDSLLVSIPAQVRRGTPVSVQMSLASGTCQAPDTTVVQLGSRSAIVAPYSATPINTSMLRCASGLRRDDRTVTVTFTATGDARVQVFVRMPSRNAPDDVSASQLRIIERRVLVTE